MLWGEGDGGERDLLKHGGQPQGMRVSAGIRKVVVLQPATSERVTTNPSLSRHFQPPCRENQCNVNLLVWIELESVGLNRGPSDGNVRAGPGKKTHYVPDC